MVLRTETWRGAKSSSVPGWPTDCLDILFRSARRREVQPVASADEHGFTAPFVARLLTGVITVSVWTTLHGLLLVALDRVVLGRRIGFGESWRTLAPRLPGLVRLGLIIGSIMMVIRFALLVTAFASGVGPALVFGVGLGFLLVAILVMIWLAVWWSLAAPAYVFEGIGVVAALARSGDLVRGAWWRTFGTLLPAGLSSAVVVITVRLLLGDELILTAIGSIIAGTLTLSIFSGVTGLLYLDQRIRRGATASS